MRPEGPKMEAAGRYRGKDQADRSLRSLSACHRLNGSSSHVLTGDFSFLWESPKFDAPQNQNRQNQKLREVGVGPSNADYTTNIVTHVTMRFATCGLL